MVRLGIVGCGNFGRDVHFAALRALRRAEVEFEVTQLCDRDEARLVLGAAIWPGARCCRSVQQMLHSGRPDGVMVLTPPGITAGVGSFFLERGIPCLLERPPGNSVSEVARLREAAAAGRTFAAVGFNRRHSAALKMALHFLRESGEGLERIDCRFLRAARVDEEFSTTLIHAVDALSFLAGRAPEEMEVEYREIPHAVNISAGLAFGGITGHIDCRPACGVNQERYTLETAHCRIEADFPCQPGVAERVVVRRAGEPVRQWTLPPHHPLRAEFYFQAGYYSEDKSFLHRLAAGGTPPRCELPAAAEYSVAAMEAFRSRRSRLKFNVKEVESGNEIPVG